MSVWENLPAKAGLLSEVLAGVAGKPGRDHLKYYVQNQWMQVSVEDPYLQGLAGTGRLCALSTHGPERLDRDNMSFSSGSHCSTIILQNLATKTIILGTFYFT